MKRYGWIGLAVTVGAVLTLAGSLVAGIGRDEPPRTNPALELGSAERVRVEVLNAAGRGGLARAATEHLRERGFDVVYYGNASGFGRDTSVVLARMGDLEAARRVADALEIPEVRSAPDSTLFVDVSVLLGTDWRGDRSPAPQVADSTAASDAA